MKELFSTFKSWLADITDIMMHMLALGVVVEVAYGKGIFGAGIVGNITALVNSIGESGFAGLVALLVIVGLYRK
jgi:hypothetical protein|tara:strand:- start:107 stop:328 length:222 start_codon:yes stop_codon:yes gene_type:complete